LEEQAIHQRGHPKILLNFSDMRLQQFLFFFDRARQKITFFLASKRF